MKHRKDFEIEQMFNFTTDLTAFHEQVLNSIEEERARTGKMRFPLLVINANGRRPIYCTSYGVDLAAYHEDLARRPGFIYRFQGKIWKMIRFDWFLEALKKKSDSLRLARAC